MTTAQLDIAASLVRSVDPTFDVVTASEVRAALHLDSAEWEAEIDDLLRPMALEVEDDAEITLAQTTWQLRLDRFPGGRGGVIELRRPPVTSVSSLVYVDTNGDSQTLAASKYRVDLNAKPARITPAYAEHWPTIRDVTEAVTVTFVAGRSNPNDIDGRAKRAVIVRVGIEIGQLPGLTDTEAAWKSYWSHIDALRWRPRL